MTSKCPGQSDRNLKVEMIKCPGCCRDVEIVSDETRVRCPYCRTVVYRDRMPSCVDWCPAARQCVGEERYQELMAQLDYAQPGKKFTRDELNER